MTRKLDREFNSDYRELNYHTKKGMWWLSKVALGFFLLFLILSVLSMIVKPAFLYGDRIITKTSFQYTEGKMQEMLTMQTSYQGLASRVAQAQANGQTSLAQALEIQRGAIKNQMCIIAQMATTASAVPSAVRATCNL